MLVFTYMFRLALLLLLAFIFKLELLLLLLLLLLEVLLLLLLMILLILLLLPLLLFAVLVSWLLLPPIPLLLMTLVGFLSPPPFVDDILPILPTKYLPVPAPALGLVVLLFIPVLMLVVLATIVRLAALLVFVVLFVGLLLVLLLVLVLVVLVVLLVDSNYLGVSAQLEVANVAVLMAPRTSHSLPPNQKLTLQDTVPAFSIFSTALITASLYLLLDCLLMYSATTIKQMSLYTIDGSTFTHAPPVVGVVGLVTCVFLSMDTRYASVSIFRLMSQLDPSSLVSLRRQQLRGGRAAFLVDVGSSPLNYGSWFHRKSLQIRQNQSRGSCGLNAAQTNPSELDALGGTVVVSIILAVLSLSTVAVTQISDPATLLLQIRVRLQLPSEILAILPLFKLAICRLKFANWPYTALNNYMWAGLLKLTGSLPITLATVVLPLLLFILLLFILLLLVLGWDKLGAPILLNDVSLIRNVYKSTLATARQQIFFEIPYSIVISADLLGYERTSPPNAVAPTPNSGFVVLKYQSQIMKTSAKGPYKELTSILVSVYD